MIDYYDLKLDVTLSGGGFLGGYYVGALCLLQQIWPQKPYNRICGASCGGLLAALIMAEIKLEIVLDKAMEIIRQLRALIKNPTLICGVSIASLLEQKLKLLLPKNAHELCSGRLGVSLTKLWTFENVFVSEFESRQNLIDAIRAGCFIPGWSGSFKAPKYKGEQYIDGAYSDNSPKFQDIDDGDDDADGTDKLLYNKSRWILISPFAGDFHVSPQNDRYRMQAKILGNTYLVNWNNLVRTFHAIMPASLETYREYIIGGHQDMKEYLFRNDLIKCRSCFDKIGNTNKTRIKGNNACLACLLLLEQVDSLVLPQAIIDIFKE